MADLPIKSLTTGQPNYGTIRYGNYTFGVFRNFTIAGEPVYDEADRVVTHVKYKLHATGCIIAADASQGPLQPALVANQNSRMGAMQDVLSEPGLQLFIQDVGFDGLVDTFTLTPDIIWGAKPRMLSMRPWGEIAWEFDWEVEFCVSRCATASLVPGTIMAWNYEVSFSLDASGLVSSRTTSGYVQVTAQRNQANPTKLLFNIDDAWDQLTFTIPPGFRRVQNVRSINKAKNRIDFVIVDEELTGACFPPGIADASASFEIDSKPPGLAFWTGRLRASYTVAPGYPKSLAAQKFLTLLNDRITKIKAATDQAGLGGTPIPVGMHIGHDLFSRSSDFMVAFQVAMNVESLLKAGGIWEPMPESDYAQWMTSLTKVGVTDNRGYSKIKFDNTEDQLITLCLGGSSLEKAGNTPTDSHDNLNTADENTKSASDNESDGQYLHYQSSIREARSENFTVHRAAQLYSPGMTGFVDHTTEYGAAPDNFIVMRGSAARLGMVPQAPQLQTVGGQPVELVKRFWDADDTPVTLTFGHKLFRAQWELWYRVKGDPTTPTTVDVAAVAMAAKEPLLGQS